MEELGKAPGKPATEAPLPPWKGTGWQDIYSRSIAETSDILGLDRHQKAKLFLESAERLLRALEFDSAADCLVLLSKALEFFRAESAHSEATDTLKLIVLATARQSKGKPTEALNIIEEETAFFTRTDNRRGVAVMQLALAHINSDRRGGKKRLEALATAQEALATFRSLGDEKMQAEATLLIAVTLQRMCDKGAGPAAAQQAARHATDALAAFRALGDRYHEAHALFVLFEAKLCAERGASVKGCAQFALDAIDAFEEFDFGRAWQVHIFNHIAAAYASRGMGQQALCYSARAEDVMREESRSGMAALRVSSARSAVQGHLLLNEGDLALKCAQDLVAEMRAKKPASPLLHCCLGLLADVHLALQQPFQAEEPANEALILCRMLSDPRAESHAQFLCGKILQAMTPPISKEDHQEEAISFFQESMKLALESRDSKQTMRCHFSLMRSQSALMRLNDASESGFKALELAMNAEDVDSQGVCHLHLAAVYLMSEDDGQALSEAKMALQAFQDLGSFEREARAHRILAELYSRSKQYGHAFEAAANEKEVWRKLGRSADQVGVMQWMVMERVSMAQEAEQKGEAWRDVKPTYTAALKVAKEMLGLASRFTEGNAPKCVSYLTVAHVMHLMGRHDEALKHIKASLKLCTGPALSRGMLTTQDGRNLEGQALLMMAQVYHVVGQATAAVEAYKDAARCLEQAGSRDLLAEAALVHKRLFPEDPQHAEAAASAAGTADGPAPRGQFRDTPIEHASQDSASISRYTGPKVEELQSKVNALAQQLLNIDDLADDVPLMEAGMDSLSTVQFRNILQRTFPGVPMLASLVFDHPSVRAVAKNVHSELLAAHEAGRPIM